jgi:hypothetical protein
MINTKPTAYNHIEYIELYNDGMFYECAVMRKDDMGNISYFEINKLDDIDKRRLLRIVQNRNADRMELWNLMQDITLNNGVNALGYFHQLVKVISPNGRIYSPKTGVIGTAKASAARITNTEQLSDNVMAANELPKETSTGKRGGVKPLNIEAIGD